MLEKGFLKHQVNETSKHEQIAGIASKILFYLGAIVLIGSFGYLIFGKGNADLMLSMMVPFLVAGLGLLLVSQVIKRAFFKRRR